MVLFTIMSFEPLSQFILYFFSRQITFRLAFGALYLDGIAIDTRRNQDMTFSPAIFTHINKTPIYKSYQKQI